MRLNLRVCFLLLLASALGSSACKPSDRALVEKADHEALEQKAQLAKYLYIQVIQSRSKRDEIRLRALKGLAEISMTQLFDYPTALTAYEKMIEEFENEPFYRAEALKWRISAARIARENMEKPDRAYDLLAPILQKKNSLELSDEIEHELGKMFLARRSFNEAEKHFLAAWDKSTDCRRIRSLQLDLVQSMTLSGQCSRSIEWASKTPPQGCKADEFSLNLERAHCFEDAGEPQKAMKIYEEMIAQNPSNPRVHFMLESLKQRQREKLRR